MKKLCITDIHASCGILISLFTFYAKKEYIVLRPMCQLRVLPSHHISTKQSDIEIESL